MFCKVGNWTPAKWLLVDPPLVLKWALTSYQMTGGENGLLLANFSVQNNDMLDRKLWCGLD